jgi:hypothetical protein
MQFNIEQLSSLIVKTKKKKAPAATTQAHLNAVDN